jgi:hypothetical protein
MNSPGFRCVTTQILRGLLAEIPDHFELIPNHIGNLSIVDPAFLTFVGIIDFKEGVIEWWDEAIDLPYDVIDPPQSQD